VTQCQHLCSRQQCEVQAKPSAVFLIWSSIHKLLDFSVCCPSLALVDQEFTKKEIEEKRHTGARRFAKTTAAQEKGMKFARHFGNKEDDDQDINA